MRFVKLLVQLFAWTALLFVIVLAIGVLTMVTFSDAAVQRGISAMVGQATGFVWGFGAILIVIFFISNRRMWPFLPGVPKPAIWLPDEPAADAPPRPSDTGQPPVA